MYPSICKRFCIAFILFLLNAGISVQAKVYLVSVGISDYPGTANDLTLPAKDAKAIVWLYSKNTDVEYVLLLDKQATMSNIVSAMQRTFSKAGSGDIVIFFFSGHGLPGFFIAYDALMDYSKVREAMAKSPSRSKMIFADTCFSGKIRTDKKKSNTAISQAKKANVMLFLSSRDNETSIESPFMQNGFFTTALLNGLRGGADTNNDRVITARELYKYVHAGVINLSRDCQHPVMWGNFPDNMTVIKW